MKVLQKNNGRIFIAWKLALGALPLIILFIRLVIILISPVRFLIGSVSDDGFYYLQVAVNIVNGFGSTFDQINTTNGYHPLWMLTLILLAKILPDKELLFRTSMVFQFFFWIGGMIMIIRHFKKIDTRNGYWISLAAILPLIYPRFISVALGGLESSLVFFFIVFLIVRLRENNISNIHYLLISGLLGLTFLSRLDSIFLIASAISFIAIQIIFTHHNGRQKKGITSLVMLFAPVTTISLFYISWAFLKFGHIVPISGEIKTSFPEINLNIGVIGSYPEWLLIPFAGLLVHIYLKRNPKNAYMLNVMLAIEIGALIHAIYTILFMEWAVFAWHFISYLPIISFLCGDILLAVIKKRPNSIDYYFRKLRPIYLYTSLVSIYIIILFAHWLALKTPDSWHQASFDAAIFTKENLPKDSILAMKDSGVFGFFSERRVVNLDGVINGYEYQKALSENRLPEYLCSRNIEFIAQHSLKSVLIREDQKLTYEVFSLNLKGRLYGDAGILRFTPQDEVYRQIYSDTGAVNKTFVNDDLFLIWKIDPCKSLVMESFTNKRK